MVEAWLRRKAGRPYASLFGFDRPFTVHDNEACYQPMHVQVVVKPRLLQQEFGFPPPPPAPQQPRQQQQQCDYQQQQQAMAAVLQMDASHMQQQPVCVSPDGLPLPVSHPHHQQQQAAAVVQQAVAGRQPAAAEGSMGAAYAEQRASAWPRSHFMEVHINQSARQQHEQQQQQSYFVEVGV